VVKRGDIVVERLNSVDGPKGVLVRANVSVTAQQMIAQEAILQGEYDLVEMATLQCRALVWRQLYGEITEASAMLAWFLKTGNIKAAAAHSDRLEALLMESVTS